MKITNKQRAVIFLCLAALCFVFLNVATRLMSETFGNFSQVYLRIGGGFLLALLLFHKSLHLSKLKRIGKKDWFSLLIMGTVGYGIAVIFVTHSVQNTTLLNVAVIGSTVPFFALLYMFLFAKKTISLILCIFLLIAFSGVYLMTTKSFSLVMTQFGIGEVYALLFAAGSAAYVVARKYLSKNLSNTEITLIVMGIAFITSLTVGIISGEILNLSGFFHPASLLGFFMGSVLNVLATQLQNFGYQHLPAVAGAQLMLLENIFAPVLGFLLYNEGVLPVEFIGALLILLGVFGYYKKAVD